MRGIAALLAGQAAGGGDPAGVPAHDLEHEHLGGGARHRLHVERGLARRDGDVLGRGSETRAAVGERQIVVDGLGNPDAGDRVVQLHADFGHLVCGVHGVVAAVVEEIPDVMGAEHLDQALVLGAALVDPGQFVARGAEGAGRRVAQGPDGRRALLAGVDQVLGQRADDAVAAGIDLADPVAVLAGRFDQAAGGGIDDGGYPAGLCIEGIFRGRALHVSPWVPRVYRTRLGAQDSRSALSRH